MLKKGIGGFSAYLTGFLNHLVFSSPVFMLSELKHGDENAAAYKVPTFKQLWLGTL